MWETRDTRHETPLTRSTAPRSAAHPLPQSPAHPSCRILLNASHTQVAEACATKACNRHPGQITQNSKLKTQNSMHPAPKTVAHAGG